MAVILNTKSYSLKDFRILPGFTPEDCTPENVTLKTRLARKGEDFLEINTPFLSAAMQAVTGVELAVALAQLGGVGVLPVSQGIEEQCRQVSAVKRYKAGFQTDLITFSGEESIAKLDSIIKEKGYKTFPVTDTGHFHGKLIGIITDKDYDPRYDLSLKIKERMRRDVQFGEEISDLKSANEIMIRYGRGFLPVVSAEGTLQAVVFKKDLDKHIRHPQASVDNRKRLMVGAAISTHPEDRERAGELVRHGVDFLLIDASDGHTWYQQDTLRRLKENYSLPIIAGNVVTPEGFRMLVEAGADAVKIGMGIGSGCTTQQVKATGRGQATAILEIAAQREHLAEKGTYIPLIADGSISSSAEMAVALALGADTLMMGNFFARFTEGNSPFLRNKQGELYKEYWMEGTKKAFNNRRYNQDKGAFFEEGIAGYVNHIGSLYDILPEYHNRLKAVLRTAGVKDIGKLHKEAVLEMISPNAGGDSRINNMVTNPF